MMHQCTCFCQSLFSSICFQKHPIESAILLMTLMSTFVVLHTSHLVQSRREKERTRKEGVGQEKSGEAKREDVDRKGESRVKSLGVES